MEELKIGLNDFSSEQEYRSSIPDSNDKKDSFILILIVVALAGVLSGTLAFCKMGDNALLRLSFIEQGFMQTRMEQGFFNIIAESFKSGSMLVLIAFLLGFSAIGQPIAILIPFFRGLGLGASIAQIYASNGVKGSIIVLLLIIPYAVISTMGIIIAVRESAKFSSLFTVIAFTKRTERDFSELTKLYCAKFLVIEALIVIAAIVDGLCSVLFAEILLNNL